MDLNLKDNFITLCHMELGTVGTNIFTFKVLPDIVSFLTSMLNWTHNEYSTSFSGYIGILHHLCHVLLVLNSKINEHNRIVTCIYPIFPCCFSINFSNIVIFG